MQRNPSLSSENDCASCTWPLPGWPSQEWKCQCRRPKGGEEDAAPSSKPALTASSLPRFTKSQDFLFQARAEVGSGRKVAQLGSSWATPSHSWEVLVGTILCNGLALKNRVNFESLNAPQQGSDVESVGSLLCSEFQLAQPRAGDAAAPAAPEAAALPSREGNAPAATGLSLELPFPKPQSHGISWAGKAPQGPSRG